MLGAAVAWGTAHAQALWQDSRAGMSVDEVVAAFPSSARVSVAPVGGVQELLRLDGIEIAGKPCAARFLFRGAGLAMVVINAPPMHQVEATDYFNKLADALRSRYGQEVGATDQRDRYSHERSITWKADRTQVKLRYSRIVDRPSVSVSYSADAASAGDKL
jgi:hypothetical protein